MSVVKYRSATEMPRPAREAGADLVERIRVLWSRSFLISPPYFSRGVVRFRNMDDANDDRTRMTLERMRNTRVRPVDEPK